jgi:hypothetical protein
MIQAKKSFRAAAEECRRLAARTSEEKHELQHIADQWPRLAQVARVGPNKSPAALEDT